MYIPTFNDLQFVKVTDGYLTPEMQIYNDELNQTLQTHLSDNGWVFPQITAANLVKIAPSMPDGTGWYESDAKEMVFKLNGSLFKVSTTPYP